jgi:hypothetical protein
MREYTNVQFVGYAITSTPRITKSIGEIGGFIEGRYIGIKPSTDDIDARIALMMDAVDQTLASGVVDHSPSTLKIFVMPEFLLRGAQGAYDNDPPAIDYFEYFREHFGRRVGVPVYEDWLFVVGTLVSTVGYVRERDPVMDKKAFLRQAVAIALASAWEFATDIGDGDFAGTVLAMLSQYMGYYQAHPLFGVTDKCYVVAGGAPDPDYPDGLSIEKKYLSNEDFVLNFFPTVFGQEEIGYPPIPENNGEDKAHAFDPYSIFTIKGIKFGVEICLDHWGGRLLNNRRPGSELVQIQLVPSCGVQLVQGSIIAGPGGLAFNCDGEYSISMLGVPPGSDDSIWIPTANGQGHSQLTQVATPCGSGTGGPCASLTMPDANVKVISINVACAEIYPCGAGEVHVYCPLPVPPRVASETPDEVLLAFEKAAGYCVES